MPRSSPLFPYLLIQRYRFGIRYILFLAVGQVCLGCNQPTQPGSTAATSSPTTSLTSRNQPVNRQPRAVQPSDWFEDVTEATGINFTYQTGEEAGYYTLLETIGGGVAMFDFDRDGDLDLLFTGGGTIQSDPPQVGGAKLGLFRNDGDWRFEDVTVSSGLERALDYSHGCAVGDFDRDGYPDFLVTCFGQSRLFRNNEGRSFADVTTPAGLEFTAWSTAAAWADYDGDGWLDLYIAGYVHWSLETDRFCGDQQRRIRDTCPPSMFPAAADRLFRNRGDGTFEDVSESSGIRDDGRGLGVVAADINQDAKVDFYLANDASENHLYLGSDGQPPFQSVGGRSGVAFSDTGKVEAGMGVDLGDINGDGLPDFWVTNLELEDNALYLNLGQGHFIYDTTRMKLSGVSKLYVGFGTNLVDFDGDGWLDIFVANGHVQKTFRRGPLHQPAQLFRAVGGQRFEEITNIGGPYFSVDHLGRGSAAGDLNNDGSIDLVVVHQDEAARILKNRNQPPQHWVRLRLAGTHSNPDGVGAEVRSQFQGRELVRWRIGGGSYLSQSDPRILLPVDQADRNRVVVRWPTGDSEEFRGLSAGKTHVLTEGTGVR